MAFDWQAFASGMANTPQSTGLLGGLQAGLKSFSGVRGAVQEKEKAKALQEAKAGINPLLAQGKFGEASQQIGGVDAELGEKYAMEQAKRNQWLEGQKGKTLRAGIMSPSGQSDDFQKVLDKQFATNISKAMTEAPENIRKSEGTVSAIDNIQNLVKESPDIVGRTSGLSRLAGSLTGGVIGLSKQDLAKRASVVQSLKQVQNSQIGRATEAGLSGINSIAEREAIIAGTKPDATAEEITSATNIMKSNEKKIQEAERRKGSTAYKNYQNFRATGQIGVPNLTPSSSSQPTQADPLGIL